MESTLNAILGELQSLTKNVHSIEKSIVSLEKGQNEMRSDINEIKSEQAEMRKEVAFYYGSMMKKLDETKTELSSEIKHFTAIQKQHQDVLEYMNEKQ